MIGLILASALVFYPSFLGLQTVSAALPPTLAPDFNMTDLNSNTFNLSSYIAGKVALLEFFHATCPYCQNETGELNTIFNHYGDKITMLAVSQDPNDWKTDNATLVAFPSNASYPRPLYKIAEDT